MMKEYNVTITIEYGCDYLEVTTTEMGWDEEQARENAVERARNNLLVFATDVEEIEE